MTYAKPVIIRDVTYPSIIAASRAFNCSINCIRKAQQMNCLDLIGMGIVLKKDYAGLSLKEVQKRIAEDKELTQEATLIRQQSRADTRNRITPHTYAPQERVRLITRGGKYLHQSGFSLTPSPLWSWSGSTMQAREMKKVSATARQCHMIKHEPPLRHQGHSYIPPNSIK